LRRLDERLVNGGDRFDPQLWEVLAETGVLGAALPQSVGGDGHGLLEQCSVLIELGRALAPVPYLPSIAMASSALARFGTPQQQADWLKPALGGQAVLTVALLEPDGADRLAPSTRAEPTPTGWSLSGTKTTVPAGPLATVAPKAAPEAVFMKRRRVKGMERSGWAASLGGARSGRARKGSEAIGR
jgi:acyl-CoA dehydrogenase